MANAPILPQPQPRRGNGLPLPEKRNEPRRGNGLPLPEKHDETRRNSGLSLPSSLPACASPYLQNKVLAPPPYPYQRAALLLMLRQYILVIRVLLAEYRRTWFGQVFIGFLVPIGITFFLKAIGNVATTERAVFLLGGNLATSIAFGPTNFLIQRIGWAKQGREFDYWVALPLPKLTLLFAIISVAFIFALPGIIGIYVFGTLLLGIPFTNILILLPLMPLGVLSLAGLGALLGCCAPNGQAAMNISNVLIVFVGFLSPMMIPASYLPLPLRIISLFVPTTYVADAFRAILANQLNMHLSFDILIILLFSGAFLALAYLRLDWRSS